MLIPLTIAFTSFAPMKSHYDCIPDRTIKIVGDIDEETINPILQVVDLIGSYGEISLVIDSLGGSVVVGNALKRTLLKVKPKATISCAITGDAGSMAFSILEVCDKVYATIESKFIFHAPYTQLSGDYSSKQLDTISSSARKSKVDMIKSINKILGLDFIKQPNLYEAYKNSFQWNPDALNEVIPRKFITVVENINCK